MHLAFALLWQLFAAYTAKHSIFREQVKLALSLCLCGRMAE